MTRRRGRSPRGSAPGAALLAGLLALAGGCPRDVETPPRPEGRFCAALEECNPGVTCGLLRACVDERCEGSASVVVPCPGGDPVFLPDAGPDAGP